MTFPVVQANTTGAGVSATSNVITLPATVNAGDMLLAIFAANGGTGSTITWNSSAVGSWLQSSSNTYTTNYRTEVWSKISDGTEGGKSMRVDFDTLRNFAWTVYRISGVSSYPSNVAVTSATNSSTNPDSPSLSPGWGQIDTLWFSSSTSGASSAYLTVPTNYTNNVFVFGTTTGRVSMLTTQRDLFASTEDPGNYTRSSPGLSLNLTIAVRGQGVVLSSANSPIYAASSERLQGTALSGVTNILLTSGTRNVQTTVTSTDSGNVYFTVPSVSTLLSSNIKFQSVTLTANDSGSSGSISSSLLPNTGLSVHNVTDTSQVGVPTCIYYDQVPAIVVGDQILYESANVVIDTQGFPTFSNNVTQFNYYIFDSTDETWGTVGTYYAANTTPSTPPITYFSKKIKMYIRYTG